VIVEGMSGMMVRLARCCSPVPGDAIVGFITKGRGVSVHRKDCPNMRGVTESESERGRLLRVEWDTTKDFGMFDAEFSILADDRKGLFSDISRACVEMDVNISGVNLKTNTDGTVSITMTLSVGSVDEMQKVVRVLSQVESVREVYRARG